MKLRDKVIFISGGASGIGLSCVEAYIHEGAKVFIIDTDEHALKTALVKFENSAKGYYGDISEKEDVRKALNAALDSFGRIDVIHNNAAIANPSKSIDETSEEEWDALMNINLKGIFWTSKFGIEELKKSKGCILNTSSMVGELGQSMHAVYTATKGGINSLTKSMTLDYAKHGIRVNAVAPAGVWTPLLRKWANEQQDPSSIEQYLDNIHVLGYCPNGDVVADACVFLISDDARFVTGCILPVSGGAELGYRR